MKRDFLNRASKGIVLGGVGLLSLLLSQPAEAAPPTGFNLFTDQEALDKGINIVESSGSDVEISGEYAFMAKLTPDVSYEPINASSTQSVPGMSHTVYAFSSDPSLNGSERGVWIRNAGLNNGRSVDIKFVIDELTTSQISGNYYPYPYFRFFGVMYADKDEVLYSPGNGAGGQGWGESYLAVGGGAVNYGEYFSPGDTFQYHYEFYDHETGKALNLKGVWNINNINMKKRATVANDSSDYSELYVLKETELSYQDLGADKLTIGNTLNMYGSTQTTLTQLFEGSTYNVEIAYSYFTRHTMEVLYQTESLARIAPATPIVSGVRNEATHEQTGYGQLSYSILQNVADNQAANRSDQLIIETEVPSYYTIDHIEVYEYGETTAVNDRFVITINDNQAVLTAVDPTSDAFNGEVYDIQVTAKPNADFDFNLQDYGYVNDETSEDDGFMTFELGGKTQTSYVYNKASTTPKTLTAEKIEDQSEAQVRYEGVPQGEVRKNMTIPFAGTILSVYPDASDLLAAGYETAVDTDNDLDRPVTAAYAAGNPPDITGAAVGDVIPVDIALTTAQGVKQTVTAQLTVVAEAAELTVEFLDEAGDELPGYRLVIPCATGDALDLTKLTAVTDQLANLAAAGYEITEVPANESNVKIMSTAETVQYKVRGLLYLKSAPASIDFGTIVYDAKMQRKDEATLDEALTVVDTRKASAAGWTLSVKLSTPMTNDDTGTVLNDVLRYVSEINGHKEEVKLTSALQPICVNNSGGTTIVSDEWGTDETSLGMKLVFDDSEELAKMSVGDYQGELVWQITAGMP